jgi:hypothetical protein
MSLCINPSQTDIRVAVNGGIVVLTVRAGTVEEMRRIRKASGTPEMKRNKIEWKDDSNEVILKIVDEILIDCSAIGSDGEPTDLMYTDDSGDEQHLNKDTPNWKDKISEVIKLSAGREFFAVNAEIGDELVKN